MTPFLSFLVKKKFPNPHLWNQLFFGKRTVLRTLLYIFCIALLLLCYIIVIRLNNTLLVTTPAHGGSVREGIIGAPRFINPILAATETDLALSDMVYAGLVKETSDGSIVPELAQIYEISPDGRVYTFTLKEHIFFHDKTPVTSSDVAFTIEKLQDPDLNERSATYWQNVAVETPNQHTVVLSLLTPDLDFLKKMTVGILPVALWQGVADEAFIDPALNLHPVGAGPFKISAVETDSDGTPTAIELIRNKQYVLTVPYVRTVTLAVYANQNMLIDAMKNGSIDISFSIDPTALTQRQLPQQVVTKTIPTQTTVRLVRKTNEQTFQNSGFTAIINQFIDKDRIVATVENGYGIPETPTDRMSLDEAIDSLSRLGYSFKDGSLLKGSTPVAFAIATENEPDLLATGQALVEELKKLGIITTIESYDQGTFQDGLLRGDFPIVITRSDIPTSSLYVSGIPLYTKTILATTRDTVHGIAYSNLSSAYKRYSTVEEWFTKTNRVWKWFAKEKRS